MINAMCFVGGLLIGFIVTILGTSRITHEDVADAYSDGYADGYKDCWEDDHGDSERLDV